MNVNTNTVSSDLMSSMNGAKKSSSTENPQDKFLTLLVTQMKNQDPLNPMDNAAVTSQMAQLSTVTGVNQVNATLEGLRGDLQANQTFQASSLIGRAILTTGDKMGLGESGAAFGVSLERAADKVSIEIKDGAGRIVRTLDMGSGVAGDTPFTWDGKMDDGASAPVGVYSFTVTAEQAGEKVVSESLSYAMVESISSGRSGVKLNLNNQTAVGMSDIRQII